jgi:hypothetical protein
MNQFRGYWLLIDVLFVAITMSCKLNEEPKINHFPDNSMEEDVVVIVESDLLASNIKREVCNLLDVFLSFLKKFDERKVHNTLALMLDLR